MNKKIILVESSDPDKFQEECNKALNNGYELSSSSCGFVNDAAYDYCGCYSAIFILKGDN